MLEGIVGRHAYGREMDSFERAERLTMGACFLAIGIFSVVKGVKGARARKVNLAGPKGTKHILHGNRNGSGSWTGAHKWSWKNIFKRKFWESSKFPIGWSKERIMHAVSEVATDSLARIQQQTGPAGSLFTHGGRYSRFKIEGAYKGLIIRVIVEPGNPIEPIVTAFPIDTYSIP